MSLKERISRWREQRAAAAEQKALAAEAKRSGAAGQKTLAASRKRRAAAEQRAVAERGKGPSGSGADKRRTGSSAAKPGTRSSAAKRRTAATDVRRLGGGIGAVGVEVLKLGREMLVIPLQLWLAAAEVVGKVVLVAWLRALLPALHAVARAATLCLRFAERHVTPARAVAAIAAVAIAALAASQWLDYRSVSVGTDAYSGTVEIVAPPPQVESEIAGKAHAWVMLPLAGIALAALVIALTGRRRAALVLVPVGVAAIAISIAVDAPKGLDEGAAALAYEGANASLLEGFWMQIATGAVLIACGLLLPRYLRPAPVGAAAATGSPRPSLFASAAARARAAAGRVPLQRRKLGHDPAKSKAQGAGT